MDNQVDREKMLISGIRLNKGFTLLEIIIVLTIMSIASTSFYLLLRQPEEQQNLLDKINYFIEMLNLTLIHVHANNSSPVTSFGVPLVLELTFSRNCARSPRETSLPHKLDSPNDPRKPEILLSFS